MTHYRAYTVDPGGHFTSVTEIECVDDEEACRKAGQLVDGHDIELWARGRPIQLFHKAQNIKGAPRMADGKRLPLFSKGS